MMNEKMSDGEIAYARRLIHHFNCDMLPPMTQAEHESMQAVMKSLQRRIDDTFNAPRSGVEKAGPARTNDT